MNQNGTTMGGPYVAHSVTKYAMQIPNTHTTSQTSTFTRLPDEILVNVFKRLKPQDNRAIVLSCSEFYRVGQTPDLPWPKKHLTYALEHLRGQPLVSAMGAPGIIQKLRSQPQPTVLPCDLTQEELDGIAELAKGSSATFLSFDADASAWRSRIIPEAVSIHTNLSEWVSDQGATGKHDAIAVANKVLKAKAKQSESFILSNGDFETMPPCDGLVHLKKLHLGVAGLKSVASLGALENLTALTLTSPDIVSAVELRSLVNLKSLNLSGKKIFFFDAFFFKNLESLNLSSISRLTFAGVSEMRKLQSLDLTTTTTTHFFDITALHDLQRVVINRWHGRMQMEDWAPLRNLQRLKANGTHIQSLEFLSRVTALKHLEVSNTSVSSVDCLSNHTALEKIDLNGTEVTSVEALRNLSRLGVVRADRTPYARAQEALRAPAAQQQG
jgi:hypothetical protein